MSFPVSSGVSLWEQQEKNVSDTELFLKNILEKVHQKEQKEMEAPDTLVCTLRPYQKQALAWMVDRENCNESQNDGDDSRLLPEHWMELRTGDGKLYYYNELTKTTTWEYPILDLPASKTSSSSVRGGILADEMGMGKSIEVLSLLLTNLPKRGTSFNPGTVQNRTATLIVCPLSVLTQWTQEIDKHCRPNTLLYYVYHGPNRRKDPSFLTSHDVVLTTYATLAADLIPEKSKERTNNTFRFPHDTYRQQQSSIALKTSSTMPSNDSEQETRKCGTLLGIWWFRVVLDEAHMIKDRTTRTAKAAFRLNSERRWCVTGTPIQNKLEDLFSLLHFLKVESFGDFNWWNQVIMKPIRGRDDRGFSRLQCLLESILLRRTKSQRAVDNSPIVQLPPRIMRVRKIPFMEEEEDFYKALWESAKTNFNKYVEIGTVLHNYAHILELLLRLRQACNHPQLVISSRKTNVNIDSLSDWKAEDILALPAAEVECLMCMDVAEEPVRTELCSHSFCKECIIRCLDSTPTQASREGSCPICNERFSENSLQNILPVNNPPNLHVETAPASPSHFTSSSKIEALLQELQNLWCQDPFSKIIVFSQWTSMLNLIEIPLQRLRLKFVRLDGSMSQAQRELSVAQFRADPSVKIFLISMKAGGLGLNLITANHVILLDPWWNPSTEQQAIDRVHRLGQNKPVFITRFVISNSIEERILELQEKKRRLVKGTLGGKSSAVDARRMREEELHLLFRDS